MTGHAAAALLTLPLDEITARARAVRAEAHGTLVTFSPKCVIPLTRLCRDWCGYCTFGAPVSSARPYLSPAEVLAIAAAGAEAGCHEALFTLGESPEDAHPAARDWLAAHGYPSTVAHLAAMCELVLTETGLLPHVNAGALATADLARLRAVAAAQTLMLGSLRPDLPAHRDAPDRHPARLLATLASAGELAIPFTTGITVGLGESAADRLAALAAIAALHRRHGHIQRVVVRGFVPRPGTRMRDLPSCPPEDHLRAIALARLVLPPDVHVQAPARRCGPGELARLLDAGIDDWGGVPPSPSGPDGQNGHNGQGGPYGPRRHPSVATLRQVTEAAGLTLASRLPVHPRYVRDPGRWLGAAVREHILDRSDADGLARDDPGPMWPQRYQPAARAGAGPEVVGVGRRSGTWQAGGAADPPPLVPVPAHPGAPARPRTPARAGGAVAEVLAGVRAGQEAGHAELVTLLRARGPEVAAVAALADELRREAAGDTVTYAVNRVIDYTNVCALRCGFCAFATGPGSLNPRGRPYLLSLAEIAARARAAWEAGATEVCLQGGVHPHLPGSFCVDAAAAVHAEVPGLHIHGFSAAEVTEGARRLGEPLAGYLGRLKSAGVGSLPGTAAEILHNGIRAVICPGKLSTEEWLETHRAAHAAGLPTTVTMMFGSIERPEHQAAHLLVTRDLQRQTGGFTEFTGLPFVHMAAPAYLGRAARRGPTWREVVLVHAVARIAYRGLIANIGVSCVTLGAAAARQLLRAGANDLGGTLMEENVTRAAGAVRGQAMGEAAFRRITEPLGRPLAQRTTLYELIDPPAVGCARLAATP